MEKKLKKKPIIIVGILVVILILSEFLLVKFFKSKILTIGCIYFFITIFLICSINIAIKRNPNLFYQKHKNLKSAQLGFIDNSYINFDSKRKLNLRDKLKSDIECYRGDEVIILFYSQKFSESCCLYVDYYSNECEEVKFETIFANKIGDKTYKFIIKPYSIGVFSIQAIQLNKGTALKNNKKIILTVKKKC